SSILSFNLSKRGVRASEHLNQLVADAIDISQLTQGAFDITILPLAIIWGKFNKTSIEIPSATAIKSALVVSGYQKIKLNGDSLIKSYPGVQIDPDGIAQGYSVDLIAGYLEKFGIENFLVEIGGEIKTKGLNSEGKPWRIDFPKAKDYAINSTASDKVLTLSGMGVSTSARFSKFTSTQSGKRSHIINPESGLTLENNIASVTVIAPKTVLADGFDNAFMVMGIERALKLSDSIKNIGVHIVYETDKGVIKDTSNSFFRKFVKE
ncbi:MAG: hypothetical protein RLZZ42_485, partial [Bacteroidota bacterium]